jgi:UDP:flavonoid glycosyltransferase YjiC (YdhE family)
VTSNRRPRILFVAEAVCLAQIVRLRTLAASLDPTHYDVHFASARFPRLIFEGTSFKRHRITSAEAKGVLTRGSLGRRLYDEATLSRYVAEDLRLFRHVEPDLVVGDLRLSLPISAPAHGVPYAPLINAYWSPYAPRAGGDASGFPIPEHPLIRLFGTRLVAPRFGFVLPFVLAHHVRPINRLRKRHGLPLFDGWLEALTAGDHTLYPDIPELIPTHSLPDSHHYLGPVSWAPRLQLPAAVDTLGRKEPMIYLTLGSSGGLHAIDVLLQALGRLPVSVLWATAGRVEPRRLPRNVHVTSFVPGDLAARRAELVICNGGSTTGYQALEQGTPVLGLPHNLDQYLSMQAIERVGAGLHVRSDAASASLLSEAIVRMLCEPTFRVQAQRMASAFQRHRVQQRFTRLVAAITGTESRAAVSEVPAAAAE